MYPVMRLREGEGVRREKVGVRCVGWVFVRTVEEGALRGIKGRQARRAIAGPPPWPGDVFVFVRLFGSEANLSDKVL